MSARTVNSFVKIFIQLNEKLSATASGAFSHAK